MKISILAKIALGKKACEILADIYRYTRKESEDGVKISTTEEKLLSKKIVQFIKQLIFDRVIIK